MKQQITYTNWARVKGEDIPLETLTEKQKREIGDQIRARPFLALGYKLEESAS